MKILKMQGSGQVVLLDTRFDAVPLVHEVVLVALAPTIVEHLAFTGVGVVEEPTHSVGIKRNKSRLDKLAQIIGLKNLFKIIRYLFWYSDTQLGQIRSAVSFLIKKRIQSTSEISII